MADPDIRAFAKVVFLTAKLIDPCEDEMCTLVPPSSGLTPIMSHQGQAKNGTLSQIQAKDQAWFKKYFVTIGKSKPSIGTALINTNTTDSEMLEIKKKREKEKEIIL